MVFDGSGPLVKRCDGFNGSLWSNVYPPPQGGINRRSGRRGGARRKKRGLFAQIQMRLGGPGYLKKMASTNKIEHGDVLIRDEGLAILKLIVVHAIAILD